MPAVPKTRRHFFQFGPRMVLLAVATVAFPMHATTRGAEPNDDSQVHFVQGTSCLDEGDYDQAIEHFSQAIRLDPLNAEAFNQRAISWKYKGQFDNMIRDCTAAIRINPKFAAAYHNRGRAWRGKKEYDKAIDDFNQATRVDPSYGGAYNSLAWLRATFPDAKYRNGPQAVEYATKACQLADWKNGEWLSTLAAAYAERGDFDLAVAWQTKAIALSTAHESAALKSELTLYRAGQPYRQTNP